MRVARLLPELNGPVGLRDLVAARFTLARMAETSLAAYSDLYHSRRGPG